MDAVRSWLSSGMHSFAIDPRRRRGDHGRARQLLAEDHRSRSAAAGAWQSLASALDRHTVRSGMSELSPDERRVITLAYLEGRTNREIAAILGVSVSTARRRLWAALKRLDAYISRTGTWLSTFLLLAAAYLLYRPSRLARSIAGSSDWPQKLVSTVAVAATVSAVGLAAVSPDSIRSGKSPAAPPGQAIASAPIAGLIVPEPSVTAFGPLPSISIVTADLPPVVASLPHLAVPPPQVTLPDTDRNRGCGGNPTSAAPPVPVGRHSGGSPVTHPGKGGCHA
jgi:hypothetical protein